MSSHSSNSIIKFADDTVVLGLISNNDETAYLDEVETYIMVPGQPLRNKNICEYIGRYNVIYEIIYFDIWDSSAYIFQYSAIYA